jgi:hypothetical protein
MANKQETFDFIEATRRAMGGASIRRQGWAHGLVIRYSWDFCRWQSKFGDEDWSNDMGSTMSPLEIIGLDWVEGH